MGWPRLQGRGQGVSGPGPGGGDARWCRACGEPAEPFKCTPEEFDELTEIDGIEQAPYFAKRHWVRVGDLAALPALSKRSASKGPAKQLERRIRRSYDLVVAKLPKKTQATLKG